jgi:hypothetical protein
VSLLRRADAKDMVHPTRHQRADRGGNTRRVSTPDHLPAPDRSAIPSR